VRVFIVGDFSPDLDEGYKNTSHALAAHLESACDVVRINAKQFTATQMRRILALPRPDIIHTVAQPTHQSLLLTRGLQARWPSARTVVSALRADKYLSPEGVGLIHRAIARFARLDMILVQNDEARTAFSALGYNVRELGNGVDLERYRPPLEGEKQAIRAAFGLSPEGPLVLHVGHLEPDRNLLALKGLPRRGVDVAVAGSLYMGVHENLIANLVSAGYHVFKGYLPNVHELYRAADLYVFPLRPGNSLSMPLSVLEAMATNLRVITTRFSGLMHAFPEGNGLTFTDFKDDLVPDIERALAAPDTVSTRAMAEPYAWSAVVTRLTGIYEEILGA
jgi:glycosyltransferase involved in cell wall biosynthesis